MKATLSIIFICFAMLLALSIPHGYSGTGKYGQEITNRQLTPIKDILANPKAFEGKLVTIEGKIANECQTGCWFNVKVAQGEAVIYVDIGKSGFAIPQHTGKTVMVEGTVVIKDSGPMTQGRGVEVK